MQFTEFERKVIELFLSWPIEGMDLLRKQYETASVFRRDYTKTGFDTEIYVDHSLAPVPYSVELERVLSCGVLGTVKSAPGELIAFELFLEAGYLVWLRATTSDRHWPDEQEIKIARAIIEPARENTFRWKWPWSRGTRDVPERYDDKR